MTPQRWCSVCEMEYEGDACPNEPTRPGGKMDLKTAVIAVDPGDEHVGTSHWFCGITGVAEIEADMALERIRDAIDTYLSNGARVVLVIEKFVLYPHSSGSQSWSPMKTSEMIGALKYIAAERELEVIEQGADIKKPMRLQLKARGIDLHPLPVGATGDHARDAELHLWYHLLKSGLVESARAYAGQTA